ncbi:MAG: dephospho-CoA kinase [Cyclobacteriaceae bacterium]|nr:dephospho-CoA kinase [Cyclobacteriaceae bacterium]
MPLQVGITGGIGSGKSLVCRIFGLLGVPVYDADSRAKSVMTSDGILIAAIKKEFGSLSYRQDGSLNNEYLAQAVFGNADRLSLLNSLVHPAVGADYSRWVEQHRNSRYIIKEAALLFEAGSYTALDKIVVVYAPEEVRIKRVLKRDPHRNRQQIINIIARQLSDEEKRKRADFVIVNDDTQLVIPQVIKLHELFQKLNG